MRIVTPDIEFLLGTRELELLKPDNGISPYYQRILLGGEYEGAIETFQIVNYGNLFRGSLCILIIGNLNNQQNVIELRNQDVLPNGAIIERAMFKYTSWVSGIDELKEVFDKLDLIEIIKKGIITDEQIKAAQEVCR